MCVCVGWCRDTALTRIIVLDTYILHFHFTRIKHNNKHNNIENFSFLDVWIFISINFFFRFLVILLEKASCLTSAQISSYEPNKHQPIWIANDKRNAEKSQNKRNWAHMGNGFMSYVEYLFFILVLLETINVFHFVIQLITSNWKPKSTPSTIIGHQRKLIEQ